MLYSNEGDQQVIVLSKEEVKLALMKYVTNGNWFPPMSIPTPQPAIVTPTYSDAVLMDQISEGRAVLTIIKKGF